MDIPGFFGSLPAIFGPTVATIIGLIFLDFVLGLAAALRLGEFSFEDLARFYKTQVLPGLLGYFALSASVGWVAPQLLGESAELVTTGALALAWAAVVGTLVSSIGNSLKTLYSGKDRYQRAFDAAISAIKLPEEQPSP